MGFGGAILGLLVHFALMAIMAAVFMWSVQSRPQLDKTPYIAGIVYGILTYVATNWVVVPILFLDGTSAKPAVHFDPIVRPHCASWDTVRFHRGSFIIERTLKLSR